MEEGRSRECAAQGGIIGRKLERGNGIMKSNTGTKGVVWGWSGLQRLERVTEI